jgi:hypothetical protein
VDKTHDKALSVFIASALIASMLIACRNTSNVVTISQNHSAKTISRKIQNAIDAANPEETVYVIGDNSSVGDTVSLSIPLNITVVWSAELKASESFPLISLDGSGCFELADSGLLANNTCCLVISKSAQRFSLVINGGVVQAEQGAAIDFYGPDGVVTIKGGEVRSIDADNCYSIRCTNCNVIMEGGSISSDGDLSSALIVLSGSLEITGGTLSASGDTGIAVYLGHSSAVINGGNISADGVSASAVVCYRSNLVINAGSFVCNGLVSDTIIVDRANLYISGGSFVASGSKAQLLSAATGSVVYIANGIFELLEGSHVVIGSDSGSVVIVFGGTYLSHKDSAAALLVQTNGAIAYLSGTEPGRSINTKESGVIIEVDAMDIPADYHDTDRALTIIATGTQIATDIRWDTTNDTPVIVVTYYLEDGTTVSVEIPWVYQSN